MRESDLNRRSSGYEPNVIDQTSLPRKKKMTVENTGNGILGLMLYQLSYTRVCTWAAGLEPATISLEVSVTFTATIKVV